MNKVYKKLWIDALRSDKYKQGKGDLRIGDSFCCLGVLCDIYRKKQKKKGVGWVNLSQFRTDLSGITSKSTLPDSLAEKLGIELSTESILMGMNDEDDKSFKEIADYIEGNL